MSLRSTSSRNSNRNNKKKNESLDFDENNDYKFRDNAVYNNDDDDDDDVIIASLKPSPDRKVSLRTNDENDDNETSDDEEEEEDDIDDDTIIASLKLSPERKAKLQTMNNNNNRKTVSLGFEKSGDNEPCIADDDDDDLDTIISSLKQSPDRKASVAKDNNHTNNMHKSLAFDDIFDESQFREEEEDRDDHNKDIEEDYDYNKIIASKAPSLTCHKNNNLNNESLDFDENDGNDFNGNNDNENDDNIVIASLKPSPDRLIGKRPLVQGATSPSTTIVHGRAAIHHSNEDTEMTSTKTTNIHYRRKNTNPTKTKALASAQNGTIRQNDIKITTTANTTIFKSDSLNANTNNNKSKISVTRNVSLFNRKRNARTMDKSSYYNEDEIDDAVDSYTSASMSSTAVGSIFSSSISTKTSTASTKTSTTNSFRGRTKNQRLQNMKIQQEAENQEQQFNSNTYLTNDSPPSKASINNQGQMYLASKKLNSVKEDVSFSSSSLSSTLQSTAQVKSTKRRFVRFVDTQYSVDDNEEEKLQENNASQQPLSSTSSSSSTTILLLSSDSSSSNSSHNANSKKQIHQQFSDSSNSRPKVIIPSTSTPSPKLNLTKSTFHSKFEFNCNNINANYELLYDEFRFLCSTITSSTSQLLSKTINTVYETILTSLSNLVHILSSRPNRNTLFFQPSSHSSTGISSANAESPLEAIISVLVWVQDFVTISIEPSFTDSQTDYKNGKIRLDSGTDKGSRSPESTGRKRSAQYLADTESNLIYQKQVQERRRQILDVLNMILYYLSLDCTLSKEAASNTPKAARKIRKALLTSDMCLQGILYLILSDPFTSSLRHDDDSVSLSSSSINSSQRSIRQKRIFPKTTSSVVDTVHAPTMKPDILEENLEMDETINSSISFSLSPSTVITGASFEDSQESTLSACTVDSSGGGSTGVDPTVVGRRRRRQNRKRQRTLEPINEQEQFNFQNLQTGSMQNCNDTDTNPLLPETKLDPKVQNQIDVVSTMILDDLSNVTHPLVNLKPDAKYDGMDYATFIISSWIPLQSLNRIITGKFESGSNEKSCIDEEYFTGDDIIAESGCEDDDETNPLLLTNKMLGESGVLPLLSQALVETLIGCVYLIQQQSKHSYFAETNEDEALPFIYARMNMIASLVDGASLLNESNRHHLCEDCYTNEFNGSLVVGIVTLLNNRLHVNVDKLAVVDMFQGHWGEILLCTMRTLTSLTHENKRAAKELERALPHLSFSHRRSRGERHGFSLVCGLDVIAELLYLTTESNDEERSVDYHKLKYDTVVFCLNTLANVVESGGSFHRLAEVKVSHFLPKVNNQNYECSFLSWLVRWVVSETASFREALMDKSTAQTIRQIDSIESEGLVTAGNGFVLLSCVFIKDIFKNTGSTSHINRKQQSHSSFHSESSLSTVLLADLPGKDNIQKVNFMRNALVAFCNFYHYSLGDLSVAVVSPVKVIIGRLDEIQNNWKKDGNS